MNSSLVEKTVYVFQEHTLLREVYIGYKLCSIQFVFILVCFSPLNNDYVLLCYVWF